MKKIIATLLGATMLTSAAFANTYSFPELGVTFTGPGGTPSTRVESDISDIIDGNPGLSIVDAIDTLNDAEFYAGTFSEYTAPSVRTFTQAEIDDAIARTDEALTTDRVYSVKHNIPGDTTPLLGTAVGDALDILHNTNKYEMFRDGTADALTIRLYSGLIAAKTGLAQDDAETLLTNIGNGLYTAAGADEIVPGTPWTYEEFLTGPAGSHNHNNYRTDANTPHRIGFLDILRTINNPELN